MELLGLLVRDFVGQSVVVLLKSEQCRNSRLGKVDCACLCGIRALFSPSEQS